MRTRPLSLLEDVEGIRRRRQRAFVGFLQELTPHLHAARTVERQLDRHLARRFNVFRYLRDDELGLSGIIADLLNPGAAHGQGTTFLEAMLELLGVSPDGTLDSDSGSRRESGGPRSTAADWKRHFDRLGLDATERIRVATERRIPGPRYIDITVEIPTVNGPFCLAFENKPYAEDQHRQCSDYLAFLHKHYTRRHKRFLLVYLPPRYRLPEPYSLVPADRERFSDHFRVLPWVADDPIDENDRPRPRLHRRGRLACGLVRHLLQSLRRRAHPLVPARSTTLLPTPLRRIDHDRHRGPLHPRPPGEESKASGRRLCGCARMAECEARRVKAVPGAPAG